MGLQCCVLMGGFDRGNLEQEAPEGYRLCSIDASKEGPHWCDIVPNAPTF